MKNIPWKVYFLLLILGFIGAAGLLPYAASMTAGVTADMPEGLMLLASFLQAFLLAAVLGFFGLKLSRSTDLGTPVLEGLLYPGRGERLNPHRHLVVPVILGLVSGAAIILLDLLFIKVLALQPAAESSAPVWWKGLLASLYGGISEEIMLRLFFFNLIIFVFNLIDRRQERKTSTGKAVSAMIISSLIFGIGHLAAAFAAGMDSTGYIIRTIILNFIPGMVFGWLYWRRSLLSAMAAHLQRILPSM